MKGLMLDAQWDPKPNYKVTEWENRGDRPIRLAERWQDHGIPKLGQNP